MNYSDARRVATELEKLGYRATPQVNEADVVVLQTCTVRQQSEDKAYNKLHALRALKERNPDKTIAVMGCVVGVRGNEKLEDTFPFVDVFMEPQTVWCLSFMSISEVLKRPHIIKPFLSFLFKFITYNSNS